MSYQRKKTPTYFQAFFLAIISSVQLISCCYGQANESSPHPWRLEYSGFYNHIVVEETGKAVVFWHWGEFTKRTKHPPESEDISSTNKSKIVSLFQLAGDPKFLQSNEFYSGDTTYDGVRTCYEIKLVLKDADGKIIHHVSYLSNSTTVPSGVKDLVAQMVALLPPPPPPM